MMPAAERPRGLLKDCGCEGSQVTLASVSQVVRKRQGWAQAMGALQEIFQEDGMEAEKRAADLPTLYEGARALAVIDVVASRQRLYQTRVLPMVDAYRGSRDDHGLRQLRDRSPNDILKLRTSQDEGGVMQRVAGGLVAFAEDHGLESDDSACRHLWRAGMRALVADWHAGTCGEPACQRLR